MILAPDTLHENLKDNFSILVEKISHLLELKEFEKGTLLIDKNKDTQKNFYIIKSGLSRAYVTDKKGSVFTRLLLVPGTAVSGLRFTVGNEIEDVKYECLTDSEMYVGSLEEFLKVITSDLEASVLYGRIMEITYLLAERRVYEMSFSAKKKYKNLRSRVPNIDNILPQYQIASYLNITNVQLSRIRKKMLFE